MNASEIAALAPQARLVFDYLMSSRKLTPLIAITNLGVASVTTRISELRTKGMKITDEWANDHYGRRYKVYWVEKAPAEKEPANDAPSA